MYVKRIAGERSWKIRLEIVDGGVRSKRHPAHSAAARDQRVIRAWLSMLASRVGEVGGSPRRVFVTNAATTSMRPLLQHASRFHNANAAAITSSIRPIGRLAAQPPSRCVCVTHQHRQASSALRRIERVQPGRNASERCMLRPFSSSARWLEDKKPPGFSDPIAMPPPATEQKPKPASSVDRTPEQLIERQERLRREWEEQQRKREEEAARKKQQEEEARRKREVEEALRKKREAEALKKRQEEEAARKKQEQEALLKAQQASQPKPTPAYAPKPHTPEPTPQQPTPFEIQEPVHSEPMVSHVKEDVVDNVKRVPDEQLPSHQERQRSNIEKRLTALMDELLPKIAVVTQKVNTYTGTDYSGIEALRREIQEQGTLTLGHSLAKDASLTPSRKACQSSPACYRFHQRSPRCRSRTAGCLSERSRCPSRAKTLLVLQRSRTLHVTHSLRTHQ